MNQAKKKTRIILKAFTIIGFFTAMFCLTPLQGQDVDKDRMDRDIRIMSSALEELFKVEGSPQEPAAFGPFRFGGPVSGNWLPNFGIIFSIPDLNRNQAFRIQARNTDDPRRFAISVDGEEEKVISKSTIKNRMEEFFLNYAPVIGQLRPEERIVLIYGKDRSGRGLLGAGFENLRFYSTPQGRMMLNSNDSDLEGGEPLILPVITMSALKSDLDALRSGRIDEDTFLNRLEITEDPLVESDKRRDFELFNSILQSGLDDDRSVLRINRKPGYMVLEPLGVIYNIGLGYTPQVYLRELGLQLRGDLQLSGELTRAREALSNSQKEMNRLNLDFGRIQRELDSLRVNLHSMDLDSAEIQIRIRNRNEELRENMEEIRNHYDSMRSEYEQELETARETFQEEQSRIEQEYREKREAIEDTIRVDQALEQKIETVRELMIDYGRTLTSLDDDRWLMVSLQISSRRGDDLPERVDLRIPRSELLRFDRGEISREMAMDQILENRY